MSDSLYGDFRVGAGSGSDLEAWVFMTCTRCGHVVFGYDDAPEVADLSELLVLAREHSCPE